MIQLTQTHGKYRGYYTSGHFIWNLSNEPAASLIKKDVH